MFISHHKTVLTTIAAAILVAQLSTAWGQEVPAGRSRVERTRTEKSTAPGQGIPPTTPPEDILPVTKLVISPAAEPDPPLKYSLIPAYGDLQPGNAATSYYRAITLLPRDATKTFGDEQQNWCDVPLAQFPCEKAREWLTNFEVALSELRVATLRETCDWNHRVRELQGLDPVNFVLPEMQRIRELARILRVKARLEIAERRFDDALFTMTMGYRLAENTGKSPLLISALVGIAVAKVIEPCVTDWIEAGGPNLYWALASLPDPLVDIRIALQQEMNLPLQMFPFLKDPEHADYTPEQWKEILAEAAQRLSAAGGPGGANSDLAAQSTGTVLFLAGYSAAKEQLIASGMDAATVDAMPVGQVVAIQTARTYRKAYQETMKWTLLPYWQARSPMDASFMDLQSKGFIGQFGGMPCVIPIVPLLLPSVSSASYAPVRLRRDLAALQAIEALRMALARSGGQWPQSLDELSFAPAPIDPVTGQSFTYAKLENGHVELILAPPTGRPASNFGKRYELGLKK
jgi:hypothetical protein